MFLVRIMVVIVRHIIDVIVALLLNNITQLVQSVCVLEICTFIGCGYIPVIIARVERDTKMR